MQQGGTLRCTAGLASRDDGRAERRFAEVRELATSGRTVECDELGSRSDRRVQRGDVRVADERFWMASPCIVVETVEQSHGAIAAADAPDAVDGCVGGKAVEVGDTMVVGAGKVSV